MVLASDVQAIIATILVLLIFYLLINIRRKRLLLELLSRFPPRLPGKPKIAKRRRKR